MKKIKILKERYSKPINHCLILADEWQETKIVDEIGISSEDGSISVLSFKNENHSPDSDHISNVRMFFFDTLDEYEKFLSNFLTSKKYIEYFEFMSKTKRSNSDGMILVGSINSNSAKNTEIIIDKGQSYKAVKKEQLSTLEKYNILEVFFTKKIQEKKKELEAYEEARKGKGEPTEKEVVGWTKIHNEMILFQDHLDTIHHFGNSDEKSINSIFQDYKRLYVKTH